MGILGDVLSLGSGILGAGAANKKNKATKAQYAEQQTLANQQTGVASSIAQIIAQLQAQGSGYTDSDGGGATYDPLTGTWKSTLGADQSGIQDASYGEELLRNTVDQSQRRAGLIDAERMRQQASGEQDTALRDLNNFRSGVGAVDASKLASTMRLNRTSAVNAGYDDAARAASTLSLRTGASAGDALSTIARNRTRDIASTLGDPETEALTTAQGLNDQRQSNLSSSYNLFNTKANNVYDAAFTPSTYGSDAAANNFKAQALDLNKYDTALAGAGTQANIIGNAAAGLRQASGQQQANTNYNVGGQLLQGASNNSDKLVKSLMSLFV